MLVGGRWSGLRRAWAHTDAYARAYFMISLLTALFGPIILLLLLSLIVTVPGAFCAHLLFVRLFPQKSWIREPRRAWIAAAAGVPLVVVGSLAWVGISGGPPDVLRQFGMAGDLIYLLGIPVFLSNLGVLVGYLIPRDIPPAVA
jgi:ABC-type phosphate transport system permease subunit